MTFVARCPFCKRQISAASMLILEQKADVHVTACAKSALAKAKKEAAALAQGSLFPDEGAA